MDTDEVEVLSVVVGINETVLEFGALLGELKQELIDASIGITKQLSSPLDDCVLPFLLVNCQVEFCVDLLDNLVSLAWIFPLEADGEDVSELLHDIIFSNIIWLPMLTIFCAASLLNRLMII